MPPGPVTVTFTMPPLGSAGLVAVICVPAALTTTLVAGLMPKSTTVAPVRSVPVMVTVMPPVNRPLVGLMLVTTGT